MPTSWLGVMAVEKWLPWVLGGVGGYVLLERAGVFGGGRSGEEEDRTRPVSLGDQIVPGLLNGLLNAAFNRPAQAQGQPQPPIDVGALVQQVIGAIGGVLQTLPGTQPLTVEIVTDAAQAVNPFAVTPPPVFTTPAVTEIGGQHQSGAIGEMVRTAVNKGLPVPEALITWVTTNRRGPNPNTSGRNFETSPLQPHERDQVRAAIGMGASVAKELVDAFNAGQGLRSASSDPLGSGTATGPVARAQAVAKALADQLAAALGNPAQSQGGQTLGNLSQSLKEIVRQPLDQLVSGQRLADNLASLRDRAAEQIGETFSGWEGPYLKLTRTPWIGKIPEFKIPEIITDPDQAVKNALRNAATEAGSAAWQAAEEPVTRGYRAVEGAAVVTNVASKGIGRIPVVGGLASAGLKAIPGIGALSRLAPWLVVGDVAATGYEFATGSNVPVLGYRELFPYESFADWWAFADESR